jgi:hypothetical protein
MTDSAPPLYFSAVIHSDAALAFYMDDNLAPERWPNINLGTILGIGCLSNPREENAGNRAGQAPHPTPKERASTRLLQIILSEAAHLIWVLRCERVI